MSVYGFLDWKIYLLGARGVNERKEKDGFFFRNTDWFLKLYAVGFDL